MKKFAVLVLTVILTMLFSVSCLAAPSVVEAGAASTADGLITVKKPENSVSSTTKQKYTISAVCVPGAEVALYGYDKTTGKFNLKKNSAGAPLVTTVGSSGIYLQEIDLATETNYIMVRAQYGEGYYQNVRLDITLLNQSLLDSIKGFVANFSSIFGGW